MKVLILAGYETTSSESPVFLLAQSQTDISPVSLTWALIELAQKPEKQDALRKELSEFATSDPSYDQLTNGLPYLNGVFREVLRLHPPVRMNQRIAVHDDVVPLSSPVTTLSGERVDSISLGAGSIVVAPLKTLNISETIWGPDAKEFRPERWLEGDAGLTETARELGGYHHIMSFIDGPRICLGRLFAVAEFKVGFHYILSSRNVS